MGRAPTLAMWLVSSAVLGIAAVIAVLFVMMATSMDPTEMVTAGVGPGFIEPWTDAAYAAGGFVGLCVVTALALGLWHSRRFWVVGIVLTALDVCGVAWLSAWMAREYF